MKKIQRFTFLVNDRCNLHCAYCFCGVERTGHEMAEETVARSLRFIGNETERLGTRAAITMTGGEVSLSPSVLEGIMAGSGSDWLLRITTNGYAFSDAFWKAILPYRERLHVTVSYDGLFQDRRGVGTRERVEENIRKLLSEGCSVSLSWTTTPDTIASLFTNIRQLYAFGRDVRAKRNCLHNLWGAHPDYLSGLERELDAFVSFMAFTRVRDGSFISAPNKIESGLDLRCPGRQGTFSCQTGLVHNVVIDSHGGLFPCEVCAANGVLRLGDIWNGYDEPLHTEFVNAVFPEAGEHNNVCVYCNQIKNGDFRDTTGCLNDKADRLLFAKRGKLHRQTRAFENLKRAYGHV
ncbi:radical SAM protein [uncultured Bilophila sp.]|uniref:radical SAM protein n=1 Tax=uncultured Bilophila sp. TaxID=529385 RepID=UPI0034C687D4